ncbi:MAG: 30S ribosomal protein S21 [Patescibacteria group bacterium]|nr:30S ribosomal protein S21 [Patescibacteria group bacterium]
MFVKRKENESTGSFLYRFSKKMNQSGVLKEARKRRFHTRPKSRLKLREAALYREEKKVEVAKSKKLGIV